MICRNDIRVMYRDVPEYVVTLCKELRDSSTPPEQQLWRCLRNRRLGQLKFRRQHPVGRYIADFYCAELRLIIEIDGVHHFIPDSVERDRIRDNDLKGSGFEVMRVTAKQVREQLESVLMLILEYRTPSPPTPLPKGEGRRLS